MAIGRLHFLQLPSVPISPVSWWFSHWENHNSVLYTNGLGTFCYSVILLWATYWEEEGQVLMVEKEERLALAVGHRARSYMGRSAWLKLCRLMTGRGEEATCTHPDCATWDVMERTGQTHWLGRQTAALESSLSLYLLRHLWRKILLCSGHQRVPKAPISVSYCCITKLSKM